MADGGRRLWAGSGADGDRSRVWTRTITKRMDSMKVKIDELVFDGANYDAEGDVLYFTRGHSNVAADAALTPEGHGVRYDAEGHVIGVTIINARWLLERDGHLTITPPHAVRVEEAERWLPHSTSSRARLRPSRLLHTADSGGSCLRCCDPALGTGGFREAFVERDES